MEIAFRVIPESNMYRNYFAQQNEENKFIQLATEFLNKYFEKDNNHKFSLRSQLTMTLTDAEHEEFKPQLCKKPDTSGRYTLWVFKQKSDINKKWQEEVCKYINGKRLDANRFWAFEFPGYGRKRSVMWDDCCGNVYGYYSVSDSSATEENLTEDIERIKLSQYFLAKETYEILVNKISPVVKDNVGLESNDYAIKFVNSNGNEETVVFTITPNPNKLASVSARELIGLYWKFCKEHKYNPEKIRNVECVNGLCKN